MPQPLRSGQRYLPGLDGLRALAVLAVIAYHEQFGWAPGGLLGVGVFFTLSGYLITDLLLGQWAVSGRVSLGDFWLRRARRLLPALFVMLAVVTAWVTLLDRSRLASLRGPVAAAATYSSNWYLIASSQSYFARFAQPQPLDHLWSLAVEEQFYLIWPWLLLLGLLCLRGRRPTAVRWLAVPTLVIAGVSTVAMLLLYHPGLDPTRVYEGTDTRAFGLLVGAALAMLWPSRREPEPAGRRRRLIDGAGLAGLVVICVMIWRVGQYSPFAYRGGLVLLSFATAAVVAAAACTAGLVSRILGWAPLRWIGVRSYGIYLWHYPVIVLTSPASSAENLPRAALQIAASIALAGLSWRFIEEPVRRGALGRLSARVRSSGCLTRSSGWGLRSSGWRLSPSGLRTCLSGWRLRPAEIGGVAVAVGFSGVVAVACVGLAGVLPAPDAGGSALATEAKLPSQSQSVTTAPKWRRHADDLDSRPGAPLRTSCRAVAHIGDSTSEGMVSSDYLPDKAERLPERYEAVGVQTVRTNISGGRSIVEVLPGQTNGYNAARNLIRRGYRGCWVLALGTNDTADVAVGSNVSLAARIREMMSVTRGEPVMWVNVKTLLASGPYAESNMRQWNQALLRACASYPNMRVFDWAAIAKRKWFISDGIHYTSAGYAARARQIAHGLARAFPLHGRSSGCVVR